tara:strand:+ start:623 stop:2164 length:1542 start_codon:yes stop_codon:yes gene_type:complete
MKSKLLKILILTFVLLLFFKVDYRLKEVGPGGSQDDSVYYYHVQSIVIDNDFDYSNQFNGNYEDAYFTSSGRPVPRQSIGTGIIASPFIFVSNFFQGTIEDFTTYKLNYFIYSLIPIFLIYVSGNMIISILPKRKENKFIWLYILGSGVTYFAFERFSMSIAYEFFSFSVICYIAAKLVNSNYLNQRLIFFLPVLQFFFLTIRWNNYHIFLIPIIIALSNKANLKKLFLNKGFIFGNFIGIGLFLMHTLIIYEIITIFQSSIYPKEGWVVYERLESYLELSNFGNTLATIMGDFITILFSQEFGLFYFSPVVFLSIYIFGKLITSKMYLLTFIIFVYYSISLLPVIIFASHAGSYGFRYLYSLIPLNLYLIFNLKMTNKLIYRYLFIFSLFGSFSQLFFESTTLASLSEGTIINSFGVMNPYSNPEYLSGLLKSLFEIDSYLKILFTSFFGIFAVKTLSLFTDPLSFISSIYVPDEKITQYINDYVTFDWIYLILVLFFSILFSQKLLVKNSV